MSLQEVVVEANVDRILFFLRSRSLIFSNLPMLLFSKTSFLNQAASPLNPLLKRTLLTTGIGASFSRLPQNRREISTVGLWKLRPYATSGITSAILNPLTPGIALTSLSLLVAPPAQIAQFAVTIPTVMGISYLTILAGQRLASGGAFQHNYYTMFLYLVLSFLPVPNNQNLMSELLFISMWLSGSYFAYSMLPELILKDHVFMLFVVSFMIPLVPLAFTFMPLFNTRAYLTL